MGETKIHHHPEAKQKEGFKRNILLLIFAGLVFILLVTVGLIKQRQDIRQNAQTAPGYTLSYTVDRSQVPNFYFKDLTFKVKVNQANTIQVVGDNSNVNFSYDPTSDTIMFTTPASNINVYLDTASTTVNLGQVSTTILKGGKRWAWSQGFDDNMEIENSLKAMEKYSYRATLYLIGSNILTPDTEEGGQWLINTDEVPKYLNMGHSIGNHTYNHDCNVTSAQQAANEVVKADNLFKTFIAASNKKDYFPISLASPCFNSYYTPAISILKQSGQTHVAFNETGNPGNPYVLNRSTSFNAGTGSSDPYTNYTEVIRDFQYYELQRMYDTMDWMSNQSKLNDLYFWKNTSAHGNAEAEIDSIFGRIYSKYGDSPTGTKEAWVAPAEQIYSYILTQRNTKVTFLGVVGSGTISPTPSTLTPTISTPTSTNTPTPTKTPTPTVIACLKPADINCDNQVGITDLSILLSNWNSTTPTNPKADINNNGKVDITDLSILLSNWGL